MQDCQGHAPNYGEGARGTLRETLYAVRHLFHEAMGPLQDSRTGQDLVPMLLQGKVLRRHLLDFSSFHTAVLWLGPSIIAAGATSPHQLAPVMLSTMKSLSMCTQATAAHVGFPQTCALT